MARLNYKLKATTLIESLIAMSIIIVSLGVATIIYTSVLESDKQSLKLKAQLLLNEEAFKTKQSKTFIDEEILVTPFTIKKIVERYPGTENLYLLSLIATDLKGNLIAKRNELICL